MTGSSQRKSSSLIEAVSNVAVGVGVAAAAQLVVFPFYNLHVSFRETWEIAAIMTTISVPRSYFVRRVFEWARIKGILP